MSAVVCTDFSGNAPHRQVGVGRMVISRSLCGLILDTLAGHARNVHSTPVFITQMKTGVELPSSNNCVNSFNPGWVSVIRRWQVMYSEEYLSPPHTIYIYLYIYFTAVLAMANISQSSDNYTLCKLLNGLSWELNPRPAALGSKHSDNLPGLLAIFHVPDASWFALKGIVGLKAHNDSGGSTADWKLGHPGEV